MIESPGVVALVVTELPPSTTTKSIEFKLEEIQNKLKITTIPKIKEIKFAIILFIYLLKA